MSAPYLLPLLRCNPLPPQPLIHAYLEWMNRLNWLNRKFVVNRAENKEKTPRRNGAVSEFKTRSWPGSRDDVTNSTKSQGAGEFERLVRQRHLLEIEWDR
jgi:hypothetical protein